MSKDKKAVDQMVPEMEETVVADAQAKAEAERIVADAQAKAEAKREAARRFKERRAAEKVNRIVKAKELIDVLKADGTYDKLSEDLKAFLNGMANPTGSASGNSSLFKTIYGDNPQVGDAVTLKDIFNKTLKGKSAIDFYVKKWAEKGIVITFEADSADILNSKYVITALN